MRIVRIPIGDPFTTAKHIAPEYSPEELLKLAAILGIIATELLMAEREGVPIGIELSLWSPFIDEETNRPGAN